MPVSTLSLVAAGVLWGTGGLTGTLLAHATGLAALAVAGYRLTAGGVLLVAVAALTGRRPPSGRSVWTRIAVIGALAAAFQACYFTAVSLTSVTLATLVTIGSSPVIVLAAQTAAGRRADRRAAGTTGLALTGLGLLVGLPSGGYGTGAVLGGAGLAVCAAAGFATMTLVGAAPVPGLDDLTATGYGFSFGGLVLLPLAAASSGLGFAPRPGSLALLAALGIGPTAMAYTLYFRGLRETAAGTAALMALLEPLTGAVLAALILGDRLGAAGLAGAALLAVAVVVAALG